MADLPFLLPQVLIPKRQPKNPLRTSHPLGRRRDFHEESSSRKYLKPLHLRVEDTHTLSLSRLVSTSLRQPPLVHKLSHAVFENFGIANSVRIFGFRGFRGKSCSLSWNNNQAKFSPAPTTMRNNMYSPPFTSSRTHCLGRPRK